MSNANRNTYYTPTPYIQHALIVTDIPTPYIQHALIVTDIPTPYIQHALIVNDTPTIYPTCIDCYCPPHYLIAYL